MKRLSNILSEITLNSETTLSDYMKMRDLQNSMLETYESSFKEHPHLIYLTDSAFEKNEKCFFVGKAESIEPCNFGENGFLLHGKFAQYRFIANNPYCMNYTPCEAKTKSIIIRLNNFATNLLLVDEKKFMYEYSQIFHFATKIGHIKNVLRDELNKLFINDKIVAENTFIEPKTNIKVDLDKVAKKYEPSSTLFSIFLSEVIMKSVNNKRLYNLIGKTLVRKYDNGQYTIIMPTDMNLDLSLITNTYTTDGFYPCTNFSRKLRYTSGITYSAILNKNQEEIIKKIIKKSEDDIKDFFSNQLIKTLLETSGEKFNI